MSSSSRRTPVPGGSTFIGPRFPRGARAGGAARGSAPPGRGTPATAAPASLGARGGGGGRGVRRGQVGERPRRGPGRLVDPVADGGAGAGVHEEGEEGVHRVVVERPPAARRVGAPREAGALDLQEGA